MKILITGARGMLGQVKWQETQVALVILSFIGIVLVLLSTCRYGVGLSVDSIDYIAAARNVLAGNGYSSYSGNPFVLWPPLFPTLLAILGLVGIEPLDGARFVNAFAFGLIIFTSGQLFLKQMKSKALVILAVVSILLSIPLALVSIMAWTEPLFTLLGVLFVIYLSRFLREKKLSVFFLLCILAALATLQRYIGITMILTGFVLIVSSMSKASLLRRFKYAMVFGVISVIPIVIWLIRNYRLTRTFTGGRLPADWTLSQNIFFTLETLTKWFWAYQIPDSILSSTKLIGFGLAILITAIIVFSHDNLKRQVNIESAQLLSASVFVLIYTLFLIPVLTIVKPTPIGHRLLAPIYVFVMFLVFIGIENASNLLNRLLRNKRLGNFIVLGLCTLWLTMGRGDLVYKLEGLVRYGAGGFSTVGWRKSPLIEWLQIHPPKGRVYSNLPDVMYILTGIAAQMSPNRSRDISQFRESLSAGNNNYLVWFDHGFRGYLYNVQELASMFEVDEVVTFSDGGIYLLKPKVE